jgi:hypothetical protein
MYSIVYGGGAGDRVKDKLDEGDATDGDGVGV